MIPGLPSVGGLELIIVLLIVLLFFGASRLPQMGRSLGHGIKEFRKGISDKDEGREEAHDSRKDGELLAAEDEGRVEAGEANARAPERAGQRQGP